MNRTFKYLYYLLYDYDPSLLELLETVGIKGMYLGDALKGHDDLCVLLGQQGPDHENIVEYYFDLEKQLPVARIPILGGLQKIVDKFWKGKYSDLYLDVDYRVPADFGANRINYAYHVLKKTERGKMFVKEVLASTYNMSIADASQAISEDMEYDIPPIKEEEILNYMT